MDEMVEKGVKQGIEKGLVQMTCKKRRKGKGLEKIAEEVDNYAGVFMIS